MYLRDCPRAEECPHEFVEVFTQACGPLLYSVESSDCSTEVERKEGIGKEKGGGRILIMRIEFF